MILSRDSLPANFPVWVECYKTIYKNLIKRTRQLQAANEKLVNEVAERQRIEAVLQQAEMKYRRIFENAVEGIFQTTPDGRYQACNPALARIYGYESAAQLLENLTNIEQQLYVDENRRREFIEQLRICDSVSGFESQVYRQDGSIIWISENARAVRDRNGKLLYYEGFVTDITQEKRAEESLQQSEAKSKAQGQELEGALIQLQEIQKQLLEKEHLSTLGQLLAGVAHEINNPVNFLCNNFPHAQQYTEEMIKLLRLYAKYYPEPAPEIQQQAEAIELDFLIKDFPKTLFSMQMGANRIYQIVHSLKSVSAGTDEQQSVDIHAGIDSTLLILHYRLKAKGDDGGISVFKDYGKLPPVTCYPCALNQVFMNLLCNAIDALEELKAQRLNSKDSDQHSITPSIWIRTEVKNDDNSHPWAVIRITDNGLGMKDDVRQRVYEPFFTTKPSDKGTGLGLSISYKIVVEKHGGKLNCISTPGQGTEFVVEVPIAIPI
ncbi:MULTISPECIES: sensor histidine kinase [unclassified Coleofasciculus]|uniref:sensor histidine kinase n=1 Tax=unclassified Coleofasciculus TaxID=2692782 RepID=UPI00187FE066|nr:MULTISPECIES: ATP-binding protein [unclassified Coleofasciculus]MBE9125828.1 PAS domain S-box protein [Coleofasciculus sp. LEGE 07081]MBE9148987.1 PAS domain S-box protein [Coleofasciculus sp. LEGE 07092]